MRQRDIETKGNQMDHITRNWFKALIATMICTVTMTLVGYEIGKRQATAEIRVELLPCE